VNVIAHGVSVANGVFVARTAVFVAGGRVFVGTVPGVLVAAALVAVGGAVVRVALGCTPVGVAGTVVSVALGPVVGVRVGVKLGPTVGVVQTLGDR